MNTKRSLIFLSSLDNDKQLNPLKNNFCNVLAVFGQCWESNFAQLTLVCGKGRRGMSIWCSAKQASVSKWLLTATHQNWHGRSFFSVICLFARLSAVWFPKKFKSEHCTCCSLKLRCKWQCQQHQNTHNQHTTTCFINQNGFHHIFGQTSCCGVVSQKPNQNAKNKVVQKLTCPVAARHSQLKPHNGQQSHNSEAEC